MVSDVDWAGTWGISIYWLRLLQFDKRRRNPEPQFDFQD
jgi:hypothetical protein